MAKNIKHNSKAFFKYIRGREQVRTSVGTLRKSTGRVVSDEGEMAGLISPPPVGGGDYRFAP